MSEITFPFPVYGKDWAKPARLVTQAELYDLIRRGLVHGIGSRSRLRRIHLIDTDNLAVVSYCQRKRTPFRAKFPIKSDAGATTIREHLSTHVIVQHHEGRCEAWPHTKGGR